MNEMFSQGGKGSTGILTNKQAVARHFGVKQSEVVYFSVGAVLTGYKVIYDKESQRAYSLPADIGSGVTAVSLSTAGVLVHSDGSVDLGALAVTRGEYVTLPGSFDTGVTVNTKNELVVFTDGKYRWDGALPKEVPADSTPESSGSVGLGAWLSVGDAALRNEIFNQYLDWVTPDQFRDPNDVDDTAAFTAALAASKRIKLMARTYYVNADTIITRSDDVYIIGEGSTYTKIVANSAGSKLIGLDGAEGKNFTVRNRISIQGVTLDGNGMVTNTITTQAAQSPRLAVDVVVTGAISHGFVHTRGWSTFAYGLVCTDNGGAGLYLVGDNNNTHWDGMWSHNDGIGVYVQNAAAVSFTGSFENNGEQGCLVDANATIPPGYVNTESSVITFTDGCYFESNGRKAAGTYPELHFGGNGGGTVRDCSVSAAHIGVPTSGIGIQFSGAAKRVTVDCSGLYPVGGPTAYIRYSAAYTDLDKVIKADHKFINLNVAANRILSLGFTDTDGMLAAYVLGGGSQSASDQDNILKAIRLTNDNNTGTYLERIYRGTELVSERGVKPNVQVWNNAAHSAGYHSFAVDGTEVFRITPANTRPATDNHMSLGNSATRWSTVYAGTGTISTSDERLKITVHSDKDTLDNEALAAAEIKKSIYRFKFTDSIAAKGETDARIHFGVGAQTVHDILTKYGLTPSDYAFWCYDEWEEEIDSDGNVVVPAGNRYGIRYEELCMFIMAYV